VKGKMLRYTSCLFILFEKEKKEFNLYIFLLLYLYYNKKVPFEVKNVQLKDKWIKFPF